MVEDVFCVPNVGLNLVSAKQINRTGMNGSFDKYNVQIKDGSRMIIDTFQNYGLFNGKQIDKIRLATDCIICK